MKIPLSKLSTYILDQLQSVDPELFVYGTEKISEYQLLNLFQGVVADLSEKLKPSYIDYNITKIKMSRNLHDGCSIIINASNVDREYRLVYNVHIDSSLTLTPECIGYKDSADNEQASSSS